jgi:hypothetical protein
MAERLLNEGSALIDWARMPLADRFWRRVQKSSGCWLWTGTRTEAGYGSLRDRGVRRQATAVLWLLHAGRCPEPSQIVCHRCDNPPCVRQDHLFLGTHTDNTADMDAKGRANRPVLRGEQNPRAKLAWSDVRRIRERLAAPRYGIYTGLAREYGVSDRLIHLIDQRAIWKEEAA